MNIPTTYPDTSPAVGSGTGFADLSNADLHRLVAQSVDLAVSVDDTGRVRDVTGRADLRDRMGTEDWIGRQISECFKGDAAQGLLAELSAEAPPSPASEPHKLQHGTEDGGTVTLSYTVLPRSQSQDAAPDSARIVLGRDQTQLHGLQTRVLDLHRTMAERLEEKRQATAQYRTLFSLAAAPILVLDCTEDRIVEANTAAQALLDADLDALSGRRLWSLFAKPSRADLKTFLSTAKTSDDKTSVSATLASGQTVQVWAAPGATTGERLIVQIDPSGTSQAGGDLNGSIFELIHAASAAVIVVDSSGVIVWANPAFADLTGVPEAAALPGTALARCFAATELDVDVLLATLKEHQRIDFLPVSLRTMRGETIETELSALAIPNETPARFGLVIRDVTLRSGAGALPASAIGSDAQDLLRQIGKAPLRDIVRDEISVVEKNLIRETLKLTGNNRSATAKVLGLSRQGLYSKLSRYGIDAGES